MTREADRPELRWYEGITAYQWTVLVIASLGWVFDVFEGQIFVASMNEAIPSLVPPSTPQSQKDFYNDVALGAFLAGGALGGVLFGIVGDRFGRKRALTWTILFYSAFTCVSALAADWRHLVLFRFLVAIGVGGEWAVASALVAEVFPNRARAHVGAIFHASSVLGTLMAVVVGAFVLGNPAITRWAEAMDFPSLPWRIGFALGALPALLVLWVRRSLREPESWVRARRGAESSGEARLGALRGLFSRELAVRTCLCVLLASVGLATMWGVHIRGKDVLRRAVETQAAETRAAESPIPADELKRWEMLGMLLVTLGGGAGLVAFGPLSARLGRRPAFALFHAGGLAASLVMFSGLSSVPWILALSPAFGFLTLGMHAGYAVYFPEIYPTRLRGTGAGFCFNAGRILAAPLMLARGWMQRDWGFTLDSASTAMAWLFLAGLLLLPFLPETKGKDLPT